MNHDWNADLLLTQHFDTPIRFYLHKRGIDLANIKTDTHNNLRGIDTEGKRHLIHKDDILFAFPVDKMPYVKPHIQRWNADVRARRLKQGNTKGNPFCVDDSKLTAVMNKNIVLITRGGHVIRGELQAFDKFHLFMRVGSKVVLVYRQGLFAFKTKVNDLGAIEKKKKKFVEAAREIGFEEGIKHLLTDLYPDNAHFIYELLQNAEDARASEVRFVLDDDRATFEHNGCRVFSRRDVDAITNIGSSPKAEDPTSIGEFGIGFKAVFAYTATPEIESGEFHFRIRDMVVPDTGGLAPGGLGWGKTRFVFPFDNPKKSPEKASAEIEANLRELNENTLLFLNNIRKIEYHLPDSTTGSLERRESRDDKTCIEISVMQPGNPVPNSIHYLRFTKDIDVQDEDNKPKHCRIAVAFGTDKSGKITPLNQGQVCIYFPATKETSNLQFHLHAPFASTVARDSVRECSANDELRNHLAELITESMHTIRDQGLLNVEFLATLPNDRDSLPTFYQPIQKRLIAEFNKEKLTPMKRRLSEHAAASGCYRGPRALSNLINDKDLATLLEKDQSQPLWIANPQQNNQREDNFLSMLDISQWTTENLVGVLNTQSDRVVEWLGGKPNEWHQELYVLLGDFLSRAPSSPLSIARERKEKLSNLRVIRCSDGKYRIGNECHFLDDDLEHDENFHSVQVIQADGLDKPQVEEQETEFHYVAKCVYTSGSNKHRQEKAREFLEKIGVCPVDETERIKAILRQRYEDPGTAISAKLHEKDMKRFIDLIEREPDKAALFKNYPIFNTKGGEGCKAGLVFLDSPYLETDLAEYYEDDKCDIEFLEKCNCVYFSLAYEESDIDSRKLGKFAEAVGAKTKLEVTKQEILHDHPEFDYLRSAPGYKWTYTGIDEDYSIPEFRILIASPSIAKSRLIWQAMCSAPDSTLKSRFRWNQSYSTHDGDSSLVHELRKTEWVPQKNSESISFVRPCDAMKDNLPGGFPYDTGQKWLEVIEFGKTVEMKQRIDAMFMEEKRMEIARKEQERKEQDQRAAEMGFNSADEAKRAAEFFKEHGKTPDELLQKLHVQKRRKELLIIELSDAEEKNYKIRARSVKTTGNIIDQKTFLTERYTTDENRMHCQMCSKEMPFKKRNSDEGYFEAVEALGKGHFFKEHEAQYLALCPECAAEYKEYVKKDPKARETFHDALKNSDSPQIHLESHGRTIRIWFEDKHWQDLKTVLYYYENVYDPDGAD